MRLMIFSGVSGWVVIRTPSGARASRTALASAAGDAMAPPSPMPLKPPGATQLRQHLHGCLGGGWPVVFERRSLQVRSLGRHAHDIGVRVLTSIWYRAAGGDRG